MLIWVVKTSLLNLNQKGVVVCNGMQIDALEEQPLNSNCCFFCAHDLSAFDIPSISPAKNSEFLCDLLSPVRRRKPRVEAHIRQGKQTPEPPECECQNTNVNSLALLFPPGSPIIGGIAD